MEYAIEYAMEYAMEYAKRISENRWNRAKRAYELHQSMIRGYPIYPTQPTCSPRPKTREPRERASGNETRAEAAPGRGQNVRFFASVPRSLE